MDSRPPDSRVFEAFANRYRRQLLLALFTANPQNDDDIDPLNLLRESETEDDPEVTRVTLRHVHLPKLADSGFIEWDRESGEISKGPDWEQIAPILRLLHEHRDELPDEWLLKPLTDE
ncbi:DUF7344 domain-containing protein [Haloarcula amylovorans]|uniref:DUF7344 domain-containing protein n=1 Tax=Haloarcula amylovorans TaxID=2562280 RepID=UPI0010764342|nr:ArsR family transcriptional regulator [Halomicroarcula amylolytica]